MRDGDGTRSHNRVVGSLDADLQRRAALLLRIRKELEVDFPGRDSIEAHSVEHVDFQRNIRGFAALEVIRVERAAYDVWAVRGIVTSGFVLTEGLVGKTGNVPGRAVQLVRAIELHTHVLVAAGARLGLGNMVVVDRSGADEVESVIGVVLSLANCFFE